MRRLFVIALVLGGACRDEPVPDNGGRSLQVPVPSSGIAATTKGPERDIFVFPKRTRRNASALDVRSGPRGTYLTDNAGLALYVFSEDVPGQSACGNNCSAAWPPVLADKAPTAKHSAVDATKLGTLIRPDGTQQLTYAGLPLYYSESDLKPDETWGHYAMSFGGHFALIGPDGKPLAPPR
jgi:predicted lipoprotein with Yx(FWY)xxD motif